MIKNLTKVQKTCAKIAVILIIVSLLFGYITNISYAATSFNRFDDVNVMDDLNSATVNGEKFNIADYDADPNKEPEIINFVEYCYSYYKNMQSNYGLYLYVYNPQGLNFEPYNTSNKVQLAVAYNDDGSPKKYDKFQLQYCSKSEDANYKNRFYKFKIVDKVGADGKKIAERVKANNRRYDVSGFELVTSGEPNAHDYTIGGTYEFSGYVAGYGADPNAPADLNCSVKDLKTVTLDVKPTTYRTGVSSLGKNHQNQVNSVYFNVSNQIHDEYGTLQDILALWEEYKTTPIIVTNQTDIYDKFLPHVGKLINNYDKNIPIRAFTEEIASTSYNVYPWGYNIESTLMHPHIVKNRCNQIAYWFPSAEKDLSKFFLPGDELYKYMDTYTKSYVKGTIPVLNSSNKELSADLFTNDVDNGRTRGHNKKMFSTGDKFNLLSYDDTHSGWNKFWDALGGKIETGESHKGVAPFEIVTPLDLIGADSDIAKKYLVNESDVSTLRDYVSKNPFGKTYLFRFAQTDYYSEPLYINDGKIGITWAKDALIAQETVFFDFDIIQLGFTKDGVYTAIPVVSSPIDIVPGITPPLNINGENGSLDWLWIILAIIAVILLLPILMPILTLVIKIACWLIALPFKAIGSLFKKSGKGGNKTRGEPSGSVKYNADGITVTVSNGAKEKARRRLGKSKAVSPKQFEKSKQPSAVVNSTNSADKLE